MKNKEKQRREPQLIIKKFLRLFSLFFIFYLLFFNLVPVRAQEVNNLMVNFVAPTPLIQADLLKIIFTVIRYLLSFLGVVAVVILIYGGFLWMTARGDEERVRKAKKTIINGLIGLIVVLLSYAIVSFAINTIYRTAGLGGGGGGGGGGGPGGLPNGAKYLVITSKYPKDGETISRNTRIIITFNQSLDPNSVKLARPDSPTICKDGQGNEIWTVGIQDGQNKFIDGSLKVIGNSLIFTPKGECPPPLNQFQCEVGESDICFLNFKKEGCCGCFAQGRDYKITLISRRGTKIGLKGLRAFGNTMYRDEIWKFNVGPYVDSRAPEVETNLPQGDKVARNIGILVIFTKEIDLTTLKLYNPNCISNSPNCNKDNCGTDACLNYAVDNLDEATVKIYKIENGNKVGIPGFFEKFSTNSFLFRPTTRCGPAGSNLYQCRCLPELTEINVELDNTKIKGANCLGLDCTNGKCSWQFKTSNQVDIEPPKVKSTNPKDKAEDQDRLLKIEAVFNEEVDATSVNEDTFVLQPLIAPSEIKTNRDTSTFTPSKILEPDTQYSPIIYGGGQAGKNACTLDPDYAFGVKDLAGNAMVGNYFWSFKTGWLVNGGDPYIDWVSPKQGPKGDCVTVHGYNLGCCAPYECTDDKEAQEKKWDFKQKICSSTSNTGQSFMWGQVLPNQPDYIPAETLIWREINKPEKCYFGVNCYNNCLNTCSADPQKCLEGGKKVCYFCSDKPNNCEIKHPECWCPMPSKYSPENELVIVVPPGAQNQGEGPGKIKVVPAH